MIVYFIVSIVIFLFIYLVSIVGHIRVIALYLVKKKNNNNKTVKTVNKFHYFDRRCN